jgi:hypothetical protein
MSELKKLYDALELIKNTCTAAQMATSCKQCPMGDKDSGVCMVNDVWPMNWSLVEPTTKVMK